MPGEPDDTRRFAPDAPDFVAVAPLERGQQTPFGMETKHGDIETLSGTLGLPANAGIHRRLVSAYHQYAKSPLADAGRCLSLYLHCLGSVLMVHCPAGVGISGTRATLATAL